MISTVSFSFDLSASPPRAVITDSTDYVSIGLDVTTQQAKGYGVLTFNGDIIEQFDSPSNPLIDLEAGDTVGYINLPLDNNGNVANGSYSFQYSLRLNSTTFGALVTVVLDDGTVNPVSPFLASFLEVGDPIRLQPFLGGTIVSTTVAQITLPNLITFGTTVGNAIPNTYGAFFDDLTHQQFSATYAYSGCTQTTADVDFIYDCEYENFGTWSVSNATVLGSNEFVTSLSCTINYPSWTNINPIFNPQVVTTTLPYSPPASTEPVLATGTYSVLLTEQIQQTQTSGLVVTYNKSVTKEFTVSCAGTLCGLVPCIENLRSAHAAELVRNRISKYQVFVDNVLLYYTEAMNYRACGELDKYKETIALLEAQLDASGCECACCDDETYYWVSNNSANSIIDELLANFQYRLFDNGIGDPGDTQAGVQYGAIWQNTNTGVLYRCIDATAGSLEWEVYYDPSDIVNASEVVATATAPLTSLNVQGQLDEIATNAIFGATNGLTVVGDNVKLGAPLTETTTINRGIYNLTFSGSTGNVSMTGSDTSPSLSVTNTAAQAFSTQGTHSSGSASLNTVDLSGSAITASPTLTLGGFALAPGNGYGTSIRFVANGASGVPTGGAMSTIKSTWTNATTLSSKLELTTMNADVESTQFTILSNGDVFLDKYGDGNKIDSPAYALGVLSSGKIVESEVPVYSLIVLRVTQSSAGVTINKEIINTTKNSVTGTNTSTAGIFRLSHIDITADNTSVLIQNGNDGPAARVGFVYAEAGAGIITISTYTGTPTGTLVDAVLNNAIIEIKIFP